MKTFLLIIISFYLGAAVGRWDAKHGYELGKIHGKKARDFLIDKGFINNRGQNDTE